MSAKTSRRRPATSRRTRTRRWSQRVTRTSDALDLERRVFTQGSSRAVAASLKRSADRSRRRKASSFQSAMSMLNFYLNRAGRTLPARRRRVLEGAKDELRLLYKRPPKARKRPERTRTRRRGR